MPSASSTSVVAYEGDKPPAAARAMRMISDWEQQKVAEILREFGQYQIWRNPYAQQCEEVAALILPTSRNTFFFQNFNWPGAKKTQQQVDATGALALHRFCAIADSLVTPRNQQWHGLQGDEYVMKDRDTRLWFERTTKDLFRMRYASNANFGAQNYNNWQSLGAFGNATMYVDKFDGRLHNGQRGFRYKAVPFGETFYGENHQGKVDRMIRWFKRTAYQAVQQWGEAALPENLRAPLEQNSQWPYNFLHCVKPRGEDYDPEALDERSLPFVSYYVSLEGRCLMPNKDTGKFESGYRTFPYAVSRYDQTPNEVYGRGWAQIALPSLKTLNAQKVTFLKAGHRAADLVLIGPDDGLVGMDLKPGAYNPGGVNADGKPLVHALPVGDIQISEKMMGEERSIIDDISLVSLFKVLSEHPNMTATQVIELVNEKGMLVAPTLQRQHTEYVGGLVERELDLMSDMRLLAPPPPRLREAMMAYEITDTSPLALAAEAGKSAGTMRSLENTRELINITQDMSLLDPYNMDKITVFNARVNSVPEELMATDQEIAQKRQNRAQQQAKQQAIQAAPAQAAMIKARAVAAKTGALEQPQGMPA